MDKINEYLQRTRNVKESQWGTFEGIRPHLICNDGFEVSVQASEYHYCSPRVNGAAIYNTVELGFPNMEDSLIMEYAENPYNPTGTVYGYVPVSIVNELIEKHGGIKE